MATFPFFLAGGEGGHELITHIFFVGAIKNFCQCDQRSKEGGGGGLVSKEGVGEGVGGCNQKRFRKDHHCFLEFPLSFVRISLCH